MRYNLGDKVTTIPTKMGGLKKIIATINKLPAIFGDTANFKLIARNEY